MRHGTGSSTVPRPNRLELMVEPQQPRQNYRRLRPLCAMHAPVRQNPPPSTQQTSLLRTAPGRITDRTGIQGGNRDGEESKAYRRKMEERKNVRVCFWGREHLPEFDIGREKMSTACLTASGHKGGLATPRYAASCATHLLRLQSLADVGKRGVVGSLLVVPEGHPPLRRHRFTRERLHVRKLAQKEPEPVKTAQGCRRKGARN